jgi:hypothetical protein
MTIVRKIHSAAALTLPAVLSVLILAPSAGAAACPNEAIREAQHSTFLPGCRAYEMVSPPSKNGGGVVVESKRTYAAADGSAVGYISLTPFTGATASSVTTEYLAERSAAGPGLLGTGWTTRSIGPPQEPLSFGQAEEALEPHFQSELDPALELGVFAGASPLTGDPDVAGVPNLYLVSGLRSPGAGSYELITACPSCHARDEAEGPGAGALKTPETNEELAKTIPTLAAADADEGRFLFDSREPLTAGLAPLASHAFEFHAGTVSLVGRIPLGSATECDDQTGPACQPGSASAAGQSGAVATTLYWAQPTPHVLSDGSDGHSRAFFTLKPAVIPGGREGGRLYLREDGHYTAQLNASERQVLDPNGTALAVFWDASSNGERVFFTSTQALTDNAPVGPAMKLYEYDASKPGSDPHNLTYIAEGTAVIGSSTDGSYLYFEDADSTIYLWHDSALSLVAAEGSENDWVTGVVVTNAPNMYASRVTPDGTRLLFESGRGGVLEPGRLGLYNASASTPTHPDVMCVSCRAGGETGTSHPFVNAEVEGGDAGAATHEGHALSDDGRYVFFTTAERLVSNDHNDTPDVYEYDVPTGTVSLLSSGAEDEGSSWFLDASADGHDVFIVTEQALVGWDRDRTTDLYDVRVDGGFPEPAPASPCVSADACARSAVPAAPTPSVGSNALLSGNPPPKPPSPPPHKTACPSGQHLARVKGQLRCVRPPCPKGHRLEMVKHHKRCVADVRGRRQKKGGR